MITIEEIIASRGGVIAAGKHSHRYGDPSCPVCLLEAESIRQIAEGRITEMTDDPRKLGMPDLRPLNDGAWSSREIATPHLLRLYSAFRDWSDWSKARRLVVATRIVIETVRRLIADLPGLPDDIRAQCRAATTLAEAARAAGAAAWAATDAVLISAVDIWVDAASA